MPYTKYASVLSAAEARFYHALICALPLEFVAFVKLRVADVVKVPPGSSRWYHHFNRVSAKHFDFVVCDAETFEPLLAIELDDRSHGRPDRVSRDDFVNAVTESADLPLLRFPVVREFDEQLIRDALMMKLP